MNLLLIGECIDGLAMEVWQANTNYTVLNMSPYLWGKDFQKFYKKHKDLIITTTCEQFKSHGVEEFVDLMEQYEFIPAFISDDKDGFERIMHTNVEEILPYSIFFMGNRFTKEYEELVDILQGYILGKGFIKNGDNTVPASTEGEGTTTTE